MKGWEPEDWFMLVMGFVLLVLAFAEMVIVVAVFL